MTRFPDSLATDLERAAQLCGIHHSPAKWREVAETLKRLTQWREAKRNDE